MITLAATVALAAAWVTSVARPTLDYLSPYLGTSMSQLKTMTAKSGKGGRALLAANVEPDWERLLTAAAPVALAAHLRGSTSAHPPRIAIVRPPGV